MVSETRPQTRLPAVIALLKAVRYTASERPAHPVRQDGWRGSVECRQSGNPRCAEGQEEEDCHPIWRSEGKCSHNRGCDHRRAEHQAVGVKAGTNLWHYQRAGDGAQANGA
jgi:hypothetical protein